MLYDKTGSAFELDHIVDGISYVRPMVKVIMQSEDYNGGGYSEETDFEPAEYLVARNASELFPAPPVEIVDAEAKAKLESLQEFISESKRQKAEIERERAKAERDLADAKRVLDKWFSEHRVMMDLGRMLDGATLYPLTVNENPYHKSPDIPQIVDMNKVECLTVLHRTMRASDPWRTKGRPSDSYGRPIRFFDSEDDRWRTIESEFEKVCAGFRAEPSFSIEGGTYTTRLDYGTLARWVKSHPLLVIPDDIEGLKAEHESALVRQTREKLTAQLAELNAASEPAQ